MKRNFWKAIYVAMFTLFFCFALTACEEKTPSLSFKTLAQSYSITVSADTETFSFENEVEGGDFTVALDAEGRSTLPSKEVSLNAGENVFYLFAKGSTTPYVVRVYRTKTFTVLFLTDGGTTYEPVSVVDGELLTKPADPTRGVDVFQGWDYDFSLPVTGNLTVNAKWTRRYTVTFETNGGTVYEPVIVEDGEHVLPPSTDPQKDGFVFKGWDYSFLPHVREDLTINAIWNELFTVTFETDGGTTYDPVFVENGHNVSEPEEEPTKDGFVFKGWDRDFPLINVTSDLTINAIWNELFTVTFETDGGTTCAPVVVENGGYLRYPGGTTKDGFVFGGWDYDFSLPVTSDLTVHALWLKWCLVTIDGKEFEYYLEGDTVELTTEQYNGRFSFTGWFLDEELVCEELTYSFMIEQDTHLTTGWEYYYRIAVVFIIDNSGSMGSVDSYGQTYFEYALASVAACLNNGIFSPIDYCGISTFTSEYPLAQISKSDLLDYLDEQTVGGGTMFLPALQSAVQALSAVQADAKHIVFITDGALASDETDELEEVLRLSYERNGITTSFFGINLYGSASAQLSEFATFGGGSLYEIYNLNDLVQKVYNDTVYYTIAKEEESEE